MTHPRKQKVLDIFGREPASMDELGECVIAVLNEYQEHRYQGKKLVSSPKPRVVGLSWRVTHSDHVSNSHSSPVEGVENFGGKKGVPTGYPGWTGRVWVRYADDEGFTFGSDPFRGTLTHTGTGGYGSYNGPWEPIMSARFRMYGHQHGPNMYPRIQAHSWDFRIYHQDWPLVAEVYEKQRMWAILGDKQYVNPTHHFLWEDPETVAADKKFMKDFAKWPTNPKETV